MRFIIGTLLLLYLSQVLTEGLVNRQLKFLNRLLVIIEKDRSVQTLIVVQNSADMNCSLQDWNPQIPILRSNEQSQVTLRGTFNQNALAIVCMGNNSDYLLLDHLATIFQRMRQERIILWMQRQPTKDFFQQVLQKIQEYKFVQMLIIQMVEYLPDIYRLHLHPSQHFVRIKNISSIQGKVFVPLKLNFFGRTAIVDSNTSLNESLKLLRIENRVVFEFALKYNLTLKFRTGNQTDAGPFDFQLSPEFVSQKTWADHLAHVNPLSSASLIVIVPCGREKTLKDVFKSLNVQAWLFDIFCVYAVLVLVETFLLVVTYRISGRIYRPTRINPFVNLRAFGAILGMPFPVSNRETLSLRQLFLAMSIFGMVFSNFFSCKLSALLTKHSHHGQVTNFEELRASGLTVIVELKVRSFIESELHADFFDRVIPISKKVSKREMGILLLSMNDSYGFVIIKENWPHINKYQHSMGRKTYCTSPDLGIIYNIPWTPILQKDSIYKWPLSQAVLRIQEAGIFQHWMQNKYRDAKKALNVDIHTIVKPKLVPLSLEHLKLLWCLLALGYGMAAIAFGFETLLYHIKRRNRGPPYRQNEFVM